MKLYLHIVQNRPFCYAAGKDSELEDDLKSFLKNASMVARTTFSQLPDRCEDNIDFFSANGLSNVHVITISENMIRRNTD